MKSIGAKEQIRRLLRPRVGEIVTTEQIQEAVGPEVKGWARRMRELKAEGWQISTYKERADLERGQFMLEEEPPAIDQAKPRPRKAKPAKATQSTAPRPARTNPNGSERPAATTTEKESEAIDSSTPFPMETEEVEPHAVASAGLNSDEADWRAPPPQMGSRRDWSDSTESGSPHSPGRKPARARSFLATGHRRSLENSAPEPSGLSWFSAQIGRILSVPTGLFRGGANGGSGRGD